MPMTNCCLLDVETLLADGCIIGNVKVSQPNSINVASSLLIQQLGAAASSQFGGLSIHEIDKVLEVYAEKSFQKYLADAIKYNIPEGQKYAEDKIIKEIYDSMQAFEYEVNSLTSSSGQSPFTTISFGRTTTFLGREIQKAILNVRIKGLSDGSTAIFPKLVYFLEDGVNLKPLDRNYDIKSLALECSTKRIYPDIVSVKRIKELSGGSVVSPMGCVQGDEVVTWRNKKTGVTKTESIKRMYSSFEENEKLQPNNKDFYIDLKDVEIKDSHTGKIEYVGCKRLIKNNGNKWLRLTTAGGRVLTCTDNHPLPVKGKGRIFAEDLILGDVLQKAIEFDNNNEDLDAEITKIEHIDLDEPSYDVTTASDYFDVSGLVSHNCRSFLPHWVNPITGEAEVTGRMNIGVQTLNLPRIGMESEGSKEEFWRIFDERMSIMKEAVLYRIKRIKDAKPENAPILYQQGGFKVKLKEGEDVWEQFNNERSTISIGYIGIYEATSGIYGLDWEQNTEAKEFSLEILKRMKAYADKWTKETDVWVSVYATPK